MSNQKVLSILIPTKNREEYASQVIANILQLKDQTFQLVIYNNSDTNKLEGLIGDALRDPRLSYFYTNAVLSFVENFSRGIAECMGEYVTIIGDDDSINTMIIDIASWASANSVDAITPSLGVVYNWPGSGVNQENGTGRLSISNFTCLAKYCNPQQEVIEALRNGCQNYLSYNLVKAYHGLIKRSVLEEIRDKTGSFISGLSPDIYLSIAASLLIKKVLIIDYPLTISGICKRSGSADSATGRHTGKLEQAPHFRGHVNYQWSEEVPAFYSVETIWADSALTAIKDLKLNCLLKFFNVSVLSAYCLKQYPEYKDEIIKNLADKLKVSKNSLTIKGSLLYGLVSGPLTARIKAIKSHFFNRSSYRFFDNVKDIHFASEVVMEHVKNQNTKIFSNLDKAVSEQ